MHSSECVERVLCGACVVLCSVAVVAVGGSEQVLCGVLCEKAVGVTLHQHVLLRLRSASYCCSIAKKKHRQKPRRTILAGCGFRFNLAGKLTVSGLPTHCYTVVAIKSGGFREIPARK